MPATINGSPTHVLIVHVVAVLLPLSVLGALTLVFVPASRRAFGLATVGIAFVGCVAVPLAFLSGGKLRGMVAPSPLIDHHVNDAHQLLPVAAVFGLVLAGFVAVDVMRRSRQRELNVVERHLLNRLAMWPESTGRRVSVAHRGLSVLLVLVSVVTAIAVVRAGDSGAQAAWHGRITTAHTGR